MTEKKIFDWLTLDMEHGEINFEDAIKLIGLQSNQKIFHVSKIEGVKFRKYKILF